MIDHPGRYWTYLFNISYIICWLHLEHEAMLPWGCIHVVATSGSCKCFVQAWHRCDDAAKCQSPMPSVQCQYCMLLSRVSRDWNFINVEHQYESKLFADDCAAAKAASFRVTAVAHCFSENDMLISSGTPDLVKQACTGKEWGPACHSACRAPLYTPAQTYSTNCHEGWHSI